MNTHDYKDSSGRTLKDYWRPSVAVDTAVLTLDPGLGLVVLEVRRHRQPGWALPGTFLYEGEVLAEAVDRSLRRKANVRGLRPRQLHVFDALDRDDRGRVLSVAHIDVVRLEQLESRYADNTRLAPVHAPGRLPYDHADIVRRALAHIRSDYSDKPDPDGLLGEEFTLRELRLAHEAVAGKRLQRDNFRRAMERHLIATGSTTVGTRGRPAELYCRL